MTNNLNIRMLWWIQNCSLNILNSKITKKIIYFPMFILLFVSGLFFT